MIFFPFVSVNCFCMHLKHASWTKCIRHREFAKPLHEVLVQYVVKWQADPYIWDSSIQTIFWLRLTMSSIWNYMEEDRQWLTWCFRWVISAFWFQCKEGLPIWPERSLRGCRRNISGIERGIWLGKVLTFWAVKRWLPWLLCSTPPRILHRKTLYWCPRLPHNSFNSRYGWVIQSSQGSMSLNSAIPSVGLAIQIERALQGMQHNPQQMLELCNLSVLQSFFQLWNSLFCKMEFLSATHSLDELIKAWGHANVWIANRWKTSSCWIDFLLWLCVSGKDNTEIR